MEIRKRDKGLCQYCLKHGKYSFDNLQVHHIIKLSIDPSKAFNNEWLISLCKPCHDLADAYKIPQQELHEIAVEQETKNLY